MAIHEDGMMVPDKPSQTSLVRRKEQGLVAGANAPAPIRTRSLSILARVADSIIVYDPKPLSEPRVDPALLTLPTIPRVLEVFRYNAACLEFALGSSGWLRGWALSSLRVLFFAVLPLSAVVLVMLMFVPIFGSLATIFESITSSARSLFFTIVWVTGILVLVPVVVGLIGVIRKRLQRPGAS
jgi:hypothetical protein